MTLLDTLYFARPYWLLAIPLTLVAAYFFVASSSKKHNLDKVIDPNLMVHLEYKNASGPSYKWLTLLVICLSWISLSGISWTKHPTQMLESTQKTILVVDQSLSMYANDIKPNRLTQLKQTARDLLSQITEGELALVAFAGEGYVISPFSQDRKTAGHFLLALEPVIMPSYGSNLTDGISAALSLHNSSSTPLHIIVLTDDVTESDQAAIPELFADKNIKFDLIAIGSQEDSYIPLPDGQILKRNGRNVNPKTPFSDLETLSNRLSGNYYQGRLSTTELAEITNVYFDNSQTQEADNQSIHWVEQGHWFALPLLVWLALQFRRGALFGLLICFYLSPQPSLQAAPLDWFLTQDQKGQKAADEGNWQEADSLFTDPKWKSASSYALENYPETVETLDKIDRNAADNYNLGNALALSGDIENAIQAYEKALEQDPSLDAAKENLTYLKKLQEQQEKQNQENQQGQSEDSKDQQSSSDNQEQDQNSDSNEQKDNKSDETQDKTKTPEDNNKDTDENDASESADSQQQSLDKEQQQALNQWLNQIQDNPGLLLQRKLWYMHQEKRNERLYSQEEQRTPW
ncbi:VWA domain-containing protein [Marinomonas sp. C2222]|uniref:VWA domain-containing protein n=1 Tax=Marinomonas sargassi TaxID=2984494 RepID=A0ABT2YQK9_9GAMM|nr:VWA domain-containing protein [Marinomonas sargassi]MCV2402175.1 VWA domain-containing protein [Marinomonas sargassi]